MKDENIMLMPFWFIIFCAFFYNNSYLIDQRTSSAPAPTPTAPTPTFGDAGVTASNKYDKFTSNSRQSESASKISQKKTTTTEVNVGGYPKSDWRGKS